MSELIAEKIKEKVAGRGWVLIMVGPSQDSPGFAYTIGLPDRFGHPDIIVFGLPAEANQPVMDNLISNYLKKGLSLEPGNFYNQVAKGLEVGFIKVEDNNKKGYLNVHEVFYQDPEHSPVVQMVWPDPSGYYPWQDEFDDKFRLAQPLLGDPAKSLH